ncbi:MAG: lysine--tRNA ligase [Gallionella sp.]|jgi:lysyl-tRNA synthetase class 2|nr:lysine--tRNA ligase [Gallionella sp.]MCK9354454.1 lysine--tRNA ligase [Gallionella sp.]
MTTEQTTIHQDDNQIIAERRAKLNAIRAQGVAFPNDFDRKHMADELHAEFGGKTNEELEAAPVHVAVAGRMMLKRVMGKASFATVQDTSGRIQLFVTNDAIGEEAHTEFKHYDLGDILGATGVLFKTKTGELSVRVTQVRLLTKSLRPLPEKFHGLTDQEQKYRQRYLDLITNEDAREVFKKRTQIIQAIREYFVRHGYLEVETPMLHPIPGGASAKPFVTHHNALDMQMYLRIAPELYLKRLVVGGFEKVFEINRNFRNEGLSTRHNPEFTMLEFYEAYRDYKYLMDFSESLFREVAQKVLGTTLITYQGKELDLGKPFHRLTMVQAIQKYHPQFTDAQLNDRDFVVNELEDLKAKYKPEDGIGGLQLSLFEELAEGHLFEPTFIVDYPVEVSPLARSSDARPEITERFELFIVGREIANGFSELNDAEDQEARFDAQVAAKDAGDEEAMFKDSDYVRALEYGLPPTAGQGIGIDRLVMLLTDAASIRDVILFPHMRPE